MEIVAQNQQIKYCMSFSESMKQSRGLWHFMIKIYNWINNADFTCPLLIWPNRKKLKGREMIANFWKSRLCGARLRTFIEHRGLRSFILQGELLEIWVFCDILTCLRFSEILGNSRRRFGTRRLNSVLVITTCSFFYKSEAL